MRGKVTYRMEPHGLVVVPHDRVGEARQRHQVRLVKDCRTRPLKGRERPLSSSPPKVLSVLTCFAFNNLIAIIVYAVHIHWSNFFLILILCRSFLFHFFFTPASSITFSVSKSKVCFIVTRVLPEKHATDHAFATYSANHL